MLIKNLKNKIYRKITVVNCEMKICESSGEETGMKYGIGIEALRGQIAITLKINYSVGLEL